MSIEHGNVRSLWREPESVAEQVDWPKVALAPLKTAVTWCQLSASGVALAPVPKRTVQVATPVKVPFPLTGFCRAARLLVNAVFMAVFMGSSCL